MSALSTENRLLIAFGRAAFKAQEIEALLQETVIVLEVVSDTRNRSLAAIAKQIEKLPLGPLKDKYLKTFGSQVGDPNFSKMWNEINQERIFLMHKFFQVLLLSESTDYAKAAERLASIDTLLDIGCRLLKTVRYMTLAQMNLTPTKLRELLGIVVEIRN